jgi:hypothetical protein
MDQQAAKTEKPPLWIGLLCTGVGLYFMLVGVGVLPIPGGPRNLHGPLWIVVCAGLAFFLGGATVTMQVLGGADENGEFPPDAPAWMKIAQHLFGVAIAVSFAAIGTWIAIAPGERQFGGNVPLVGSTGEIIGRTAFGLGAAIVWLFALALFNRARKQIFGGGKN